MAPAYDLTDVELFELDAFAHAADQRSVGELLFDVDRQARLLLMDLSEQDAGPLLHAWPDLINAASNMWDAMPKPQAAPTATATHEETCMERLAAISDSVKTRLAVKRWPAPSDPDQRLEEMARTLARAAHLTRRFALDGPVTEAGRADLDSARARLVHATYLATHAVSVALLEHGRTRHNNAATTPRPLTAPGAGLPYAVAPTTEWLRRIGAAEAALARIVGQRPLAPLLNAERSTPPHTERLERALARWDVQAHRGLASDAWRHNIVLITRTQAFIAGTTLTLLDAAHAADTVDVPTRLLQTIARSGAAWSDLGSRWDDLTPAQAHATGTLTLAAGELRAAARELTHDGATRASARTIAFRPGAAAALQAALAFVGHTDELAHAADERSSTPGLAGHARSMSVRIHNDIEAGRVPTAIDTNAAWVSPNDIRDGRMVPAPVPLITMLRTSSRSVVKAATEAAATAEAATAVAARMSGPNGAQPYGATEASSCSQRRSVDGPVQNPPRTQRASAPPGPCA